MVCPLLTSYWQIHLLKAPSKVILMARLLISGKGSYVMKPPSSHLSNTFIVIITPWQSLIQFGHLQAAIRMKLRKLLYKLGYYPVATGHAGCPDIGHQMLAGIVSYLTVSIAHHLQEHSSTCYYTARTFSQHEPALLPCGIRHFPLPKSCPRLLKPAFNLIMTRKNQYNFYWTVACYLKLLCYDRLTEIACWTNCFISHEVTVIQSTKLDSDFLVNGRNSETQCVWQYLALLNFLYVAAILPIVEWKTTFNSE